MYLVFNIGIIISLIVVEFLDLRNAGCNLFRIKALTDFKSNYTSNIPLIDHLVSLDNDF